MEQWRFGIPARYSYRNRDESRKISRKYSSSLYGDVMGQWHGESCETPKSCNFIAKDEIIFVQLWAGDIIDGLKFITREGDRFAENKQILDLNFGFLIS